MIVTMVVSMMVWWLLLMISVIGDDCDTDVVIF